MKPSQIDHILVGTRWKSWARSCKVRWGASRQRWGRKEDHGTVSATFTVRSRATQPKRKIDLFRLKDSNCKELYQKQLKAKLISENNHDIWQRAVVIPDSSDINGRWLHLKQTINDVAVKVLKHVVNPL